MVITNIPQHDGRGYIIPVTFGHEFLTLQQTSRASGLGVGILLYENLGVKHPVPFQCLLSFGYNHFGGINADHLFDIKPGLVNGKPVCYLVPKSVVVNVVQATSFSDADLSLVVKVFDEMQGRSISSDPVKLSFVPAFVVSEKEIQLSYDVRKARIVVTGNSQQLDNLEVCQLTHSIPYITTSLLESALKSYVPVTCNPSPTPVSCVKSYCMRYHTIPGSSPRLLDCVTIPYQVCRRDYQIALPYHTRFVSEITRLRCHAIPGLSPRLPDCFTIPYQVCLRDYQIALPSHTRFVSKITRLRYHTIPGWMHTCWLPLNHSLTFAKTTALACLYGKRNLDEFSEPSINFLCYSCKLR